jgi:ABC-type nickel/cobalt efflux system permease component RcnA
MLGLDDSLARLSDGTSLVLVIAVAVLLGLRHATDPDHLAAVTTLIASTEQRARDAAKLGLAWGVGHAFTLFGLGVPIVLYRAYLPEAVQRAAETAIGFLIAGLAVWLLVRWRRGAFHAHAHEHDDRSHAHLHSHREGRHAHARSRTPLGAFGVGLLHGIGGSAGVGILLVTTIDSRALALAALAILATFTAVSMTLLTTGFGLTLASKPLGRFVPALGTASLAFGLWYALGAQGVLPYYF